MTSNVDSYMKSFERAPKVNEPCLECNEGAAVPYRIDGDGELDSLLGYDTDNVSVDWLFDNPLIPEDKKEQHFRDTFLLRVLDRAAELMSAEEISELYAYLHAEDYQFFCLDDGLSGELVFSDDLMERQSHLPGFMMRTFEHDRKIITKGTVGGSEQIILRENPGNNLIFANNNIIYTTFTKAIYVDEGGHGISREYSWRIEGLRNVEVAAQSFVENYKKAKANSEWWGNFWAWVEIGSVAISVVPIAGQISLAARGVHAGIKTLKYTLYAAETALAVDSLTHGVTHLFRGKGIELGEALFKAIGEYANPTNGEERGQQAFMAFNLLLLASPASLNPRRWKKIKRFAKVEGKAPVIPTSKDLEQAYEISKDAAKAHGVAQKGLVYSPHVEFTRGPFKAIARPSLDKDTWFQRFDIAGAKANGQFQTPGAQKSLMLMVHNAAGNLRVVGKVAKAVGNAGEAVLKQKLVSHFGVKESHIMGAISNRSGNGIDLLVRVPPPDTLNVRIPKNYTESNSIIKADHNIQSIDLRKHPVTGAPLADGELIIVLENKTTLGLDYTSDMSTLQRQGGAKNTERIRDQVALRKRGYSDEALLENNLEYQKSLKLYDEALDEGRVLYIHSQTFLKQTGETRSVIGNGSGVQLNIWYYKNMPLEGIYSVISTL